MLLATVTARPVNPIGRSHIGRPAPARNSWTRVIPPLPDIMMTDWSAATQPDHQPVVAEESKFEYVRSACVSYTSRYVEFSVSGRVSPTSHSNSLRPVHRYSRPSMSAAPIHGAAAACELMTVVAALPAAALVCFTTIRFVPSPAAT